MMQEQAHNTKQLSDIEAKLNSLLVSQEEAVKQSQEVIHENKMLKEVIRGQTGELEALRREMLAISGQKDQLELESNSLKDLNTELMTRCRDLNSQVQKEREQVIELKATISAFQLAQSATENKKFTT